MRKEVIILPHYAEAQGAAFDVDDTLVFLKPGVTVTSAADPSKLISLPVDLIPHPRHLQSIKNHWSRGHHVVVWSAGGKPWAEFIVRHFGVSEYVHETMTKFKWFYDDRELNQLGDRIYYNDKESAEAISAYKEALKKNDG